jgi:hypothetical protein
VERGGVEHGEVRHIRLAEQEEDFRAAEDHAFGSIAAEVFAYRQQIVSGSRVALAAP